MEDDNNSKVNRSQHLLLICISLHFSIVAINHTKPTFQNYTPKPQSTDYQTQNDSSVQNVNEGEMENVSIISMDGNETIQNLKNRYEVNLQNGGQSMSTYETSFIKQRNNSTSTSTLCMGSTTPLCQTQNIMIDILKKVGNDLCGIERNETTIVTEWQLTHTRSTLSTIAVSLYFLGVIIGSLPAGLLADRFGRRIVMLTCFYCQAILSIVIYYNTSFVLYTILRTLQGFFVQGLQNSSYTLLIELFPTKWRTYVAWLTDICWTLGLIILSVMSYSFPNWRQAELLTTLPFVCLSFVYVWFIPESPRWKFTKNKIIEFEYLCDSSNDNSMNEYTNEPVVPINTGIEYLSAENFISKHISMNSTIHYKPNHSQTVPNILQYKGNDSFNSIQTDKNISNSIQRFDTLDSYGSIEDLRISLSSVVSEFDSVIKEYRNSFNLKSEEEEDEDVKLNTHLVDKNNINVLSNNDTDCIINNNQINSKTKENENIISYTPVFDDKSDISPSIISSGKLSSFQYKDINYYNNNYQYCNDNLRQIDTAIARDKLLRELNKCVRRECCKRKTLDELLLLIEQKRLTKNDVRNVCKEIYSNSIIRNRLAIMCYLWFVTSISYYGVTFSVPALSGDRFINFFYGACFEFIFFSFSCLIITKIGRKFPLFCFYIVSALIFTFIFLISIFNFTQISACDRTILVLLGKGTIVGTFFTVFIYCAELFPTPMRAACNGISSLSCRIGSLLAPYFLMSAMEISQDAMLLFIGILTFSASLLTLCLPETHLKQLPDTLDDALKLSNGKKCCHKNDIVNKLINS